MKIPKLVVGAVMMSFLSSSFAQEIKNADFSKGKSGWLGDGTIVYFDAAGGISETESPGAVSAIKLELSKNSWRELKQTLRAKPDESTLSFSVQVMAAPDFKRLLESRDYSDVDFGEGGSWVWSALVFPACDFLVRVEDGSWHYRPFSLKPVGTWKSFDVNLSKLQTRKREIALLFPPGEGTVYLKGK